MMKALQFRAPGKPEIVETVIPVPASDEVLLKVEAVTTCPHWDIHIMAGEPMFPGGTLDYPYPIGQPGHEAAGEIISVGSEVRGIVPGDRVAAWRDPGPGHDGCYAQYARRAAENVIKIPTDVAISSLAPLELAMCVQVSFDRLMELGHVRGERFGVGGLGPAGLVAIQMARAYGAKEVVAYEPLPERRSIAEAIGVDRVYDPADAPSPDGDASLDSAIDCTGMKVVVEDLMARTKKTVTIFGVLRETVGFTPRQWSGFTLMGYGTHNRGAAERALALIREGKLSLAPLVTESLPLTRYVEGVELLKAKGATKICYLPWA